MAVINNAYETKGTHLFFVDTVTASAGRRSPNSPARPASPASTPAPRTASTPPAWTTPPDRSTSAACPMPAKSRVPFILYKGDASHKALFELNERRGDIVGWIVGLSDSTAEPTLGTDDSLVRPPARTTLAFDGYVSGVTIDAAINEVVRGTLTIQSSGDADARVGHSVNLDPRFFLSDEVHPRNVKLAGRHRARDALSRSSRAPTCAIAGGQGQRLRHGRTHARSLPVRPGRHAAACRSSRSDLRPAFFNAISNT